jgi:3-oxoacyl-[acyl-carrier-protein] synthase II
MVAERTLVRGIGMVGSFGTSPADLFDRIAAGSPRLTPTLVRGGGREVELPVHAADLSRLLEFIPKRGARRVDRLSGLSLLAAHLALQDAGIDPAGERTGLVIATGYGASRSTADFLDSLIDGTDLGASPTAFAGSVHSSAAAQVSIGLGIRGPTLTITQFELSCGEALRVACQWLSSGRVDTVLVGAADEVSAMVGYCWQRLTAGLCQTAAAPTPGEGAAFLVLQRGAAGPAAPCIGAVSTGATWAPADDWQPDTVILGDDGLACPQNHYRQALPAHAAAVCLTPFYGVFPASQMLDVAAVLAAWRAGDLAALRLQPPNAAKFQAAPSVADGKVGRGCHYPTPAASLARDRQSPRAAQQNDKLSSIVQSRPAGPHTATRPTVACLKFDLDGRYSLVCPVFH